MLSKHTRTRLIRVGGKKRRAHRVIVERAIGRTLVPTEHVHHRDHNPLNNDLANLEVLDAAVHFRLHGDERRKYSDRKNCAKCGAVFVVNPRKRRRNKCCSAVCAAQMRADGRRAQAGAL